MAQRIDIVAMILVFGILVLFSDMVRARTDVVGISDGSCSQEICWTFNVTNWPDDKSFNSGDVLEFNYNPSVHNVVYVNEEGYRTCKVPKDPRFARVFRTGHDSLQLPDEGPIYFISSMNNDCKRGMRIAITLM